MEAAEERARKDREAQKKAMEARNKLMEAIAENVGATQYINPMGFPHEQVHMINQDGDERHQKQHPIKQKDDKMASCSEEKVVVGKVSEKMTSGQNAINNECHIMGAGQNAINDGPHIKGAGQNAIKYGHQNMGAGQNQINFEKDNCTLVKLVEEFKDVFDKDKLPPMDTEPMVIKLKENYVAKAITVPRKVPYARRDDEIKEIRRLESEGIIESVGDRPTEFCSPTICPVKADGTLRFATDFTYLNWQVLRTVHPTLSAWDAIHTINPKAQYFSTFDCKKGYWQVPLAEESKDLTTFLCTLGKFRYTRAPMGFISTGDSYNQRCDKMLHGLNGITKIVDDILVTSETFEQHVDDVRALLQRCSESNITLNRKKLILGRSKV